MKHIHITSNKYMHACKPNLLLKLVSINHKSVLTMIIMGEFYSILSDLKINLIP